jgi:hypothetical protein
MLRRTVTLALPLLAGAIGFWMCVASSSNAAPPVAQKKPHKVVPVTPGPTAMATGPSGIRVVGVRDRSTTDGSPWPYQPGTTLAYEVDVLNPTSTERTVFIEQDGVGPYSVTLPANGTKAFLIARPYWFFPCLADQSWSVWIRENPEAKRTIKMTPSCTFSVVPPASNPLQMKRPATLPLGKLTYYGAKVNSAPSRCDEPFFLEANLRNGTSSTINAGLYMMGYPSTNVSIAPGETKSAVLTGVAHFVGGDGHPAKLRLKDNANPSNPAVVEGTYSVNIVANCQATFLLHP